MLFLGVSRRMFLDMISICLSGLSKLCSSVWVSISWSAENLNGIKGRWKNWSFSPASFWDLYHWFLWFSGLQIQTELWPLVFLGLQPSGKTVGFLNLYEDMSQFLIIKKNVCFYIYIHLLVLFLWKTLTNTVSIQVFYLVLSSTHLTKYQKEIHILWNIHLKS